MSNTSTVKKITGITLQSHPYSYPMQTFLWVDVSPIYVVRSSKTLSYQGHSWVLLLLQLHKHTWHVVVILHPLLKLFSPRSLLHSSNQEWSGCAVLCNWLFVSKSRSRQLWYLFSRLHQRNPQVLTRALAHLGHPSLYTPLHGPKNITQISHLPLRHVHK